MKVPSKGKIMNNEQVWSEQVRSLVMRTIPYADQITHIELHKDGIRFTWKKNRFQVIYISNNIYVDEMIDGVFLYGATSILLQQLLRLSGCQVPSKGKSAIILKGNIMTKKTNIAKRMAGAMRNAAIASGNHNTLFTRVADDTVKQKNRKDRRNSKKKLSKHEG